MAKKTPLRLALKKFPQITSFSLEKQSQFTLFSGSLKKSIAFVFSLLTPLSEPH
jgi:hypothetical protein